MQHRTIKALLAVLVLVLVSLACNFSASTANLDSAKMAFDPEGSQPTTTFGQEDIFYCVVELKNAPDDTVVRAVWTAVDVEGVEPDFLIDETSITSASSKLHFELSNNNLWPAGTYKVDLYLNDELNQTLEFNVE